MIRYGFVAHVWFENLFVQSIAQFVINVWLVLIITARGLGIVLALEITNISFGISFHSFLWLFGSFWALISVRFLELFFIFLWEIFYNDIYNFDKTGDTTSIPTMNWISPHLSPEPGFTTDGSHGLRSTLPFTAFGFSV